MAYEAIARALLLPLFFLLSPFILLRLRGFDFRASLKYLFLKTEDFISLNGISRSVYYGMLLLIAMLAITYIESLIMLQLGLLDLDKVAESIRRQPLVILYVAILLSPFAEEIFFRGLLQRKAGLLISAVIFGAFHALYGSVAEVIGAFTIALVLGAYVHFRKSLAAPILAHIFYNALSISTIL